MTHMFENFEVTFRLRSRLLSATLAREKMQLVRNMSEIFMSVWLRVDLRVRAKATE
jgi:hypothetical protein